MEELEHVEFLPEPEDARILSAIDPAAVGFQGAWRAEVTGWAPLQAAPIQRRRRQRALLANGFMFAIFISAMFAIWNSGLLIVELNLPTSEWANETTQLNDASDAGLTGVGVRVCMVDTGIDSTHDALSGVELTFKDLRGAATAPVDYGLIAHGTLMAGILVADGHQTGAAPGISLGVAAALGADDDGGNSGDERTVAEAIRWCQDSFEADIISLSLGGEQDLDATREGATASATRRAVDSGIFVVAAAGNDGGSEDDGLVSVPANIPRVITVGATNIEGQVWENSSRGSQERGNGEMRTHPHQKPEVVAPGVQIISTGSNNAWYSSSGTSDATVFVTAALALLLEAHPEYKPMPGSDGTCIDVIKTALMNSVEPLHEEGVHDDRSGYGELRAVNWIDEVTATAPSC